MRKSLSVDESLLNKNAINRKILNDIMYYIRKTIKLVRRAQSLSLTEGTEYELIRDEFKNMSRKIEELVEKI